MDYHIRYYIKSIDFFTLSANFLGFLSIISFIERKYYAGVIFLFLAAILDYLDGKISRDMNKSTPFGKALDYMQDVTTYCISIAVFLYRLFIEWWILPVLFIFISTCLLRLARQFNIPDGENYYVGLPVTFNLVIPLLYLMKVYNSLMYIFIIVLLSILMISTIRMHKI